MDSIRKYSRVIKGGTRRLDYGSYVLNIPRVPNIRLEANWAGLEGVVYDSRIKKMLRLVCPGQQDSRNAMGLEGLRFRQLFKVPKTCQKLLKKEMLPRFALILYCGHD